MRRAIGLTMSKGLSTDFLLPYLNSKAMAGKFAVGEFFDGNRLLVNLKVDIQSKRDEGSSQRVRLHSLKFLLNGMCNNPGTLQHG